MRLVSWNVNGIRAALRKGFEEFLRGVDADLVCVQEIKARPEQVQIVLEDHRYAFWNPADRPGYSGTAVFCKSAPVDVTRGMGQSEHDAEGRVLTVETRGFYLVNVYVPNAKRDLSRLPYRQRWDAAFLGFLQGLERTKPVIVCGDFNVAHAEIDLAHPRANVGNHGFTDEERAGFQAFLDAGFVDTFRRDHPEESGHYTWWSNIPGVRARNVGWRIDYFLASDAVAGRVRAAWHLPEVLGSDHCPVGIALKR